MSVAKGDHARCERERVAGYETKARVVDLLRFGRSVDIQKWLAAASLRPDLQRLAMQSLPPEERPKARRRKST